MSYRILLALACFAFSANQALSANIAIIDSGVDYKHKSLVNNIWSNPEKPRADGNVRRNGL